MSIECSRALCFIDFCANSTNYFLTLSLCKVKFQLVVFSSPPNMLLIAAAAYESPWSYSTEQNTSWWHFEDKVFQSLKQLQLFKIIYSYFTYENTMRNNMKLKSRYFTFIASPLPAAL